MAAIYLQEKNSSKPCKAHPQEKDTISLIKVMSNEILANTKILSTQD